MLKDLVETFICSVLEEVGIENKDVAKIEITPTDINVRIFERDKDDCYVVENIYATDINGDMHLYDKDIKSKIVTFKWRSFDN